jgi:hypothetical protein
MKLSNNLRSFGLLGATFASLFSISFEQKVSAPIPYHTTDAQQQCPTVVVECPSSFDYEKPLTFTATVNALGGAAISYDWAISAGKILTGQGTPTITVDVSGMGGQGITATVTVQGLAKECGRQASCSIIYEPPSSPAVLFDRYYPKSDYSAKRLRQKTKARRQNRY